MKKKDVVHPLPPPSITQKTVFEFDGQHYNTAAEAERALQRWCLVDYLNYHPGINHDDLDIVDVIDVLLLKYDIVPK